MQSAVTYVSCFHTSTRERTVHDVIVKECEGVKKLQCRTGTHNTFIARVGTCGNTSPVAKSGPESFPAGKQ
jgi:hypothetical protein